MHTPVNKFENNPGWTHVLDSQGNPESFGFLDLLQMEFLLHHKFAHRHPFILLLFSVI